MPASFCPDCGSSLAPRAAFCTACGRSMDDLRGAPAPRRRSRLRTPVVAVVALVLLVPVAVVGVAGWRIWQEQREFERMMSKHELVEFVEVDGTTTPAPREVYGTAEVEEVPVLVNRAEVAEALTRQYPPLMRDAGVAGEVQVQFRVLPDGTVDPAQLTVLDASHPAFAEAAERVAQRMRFRAGRLGGEAVTTEVVLPISFRISW